MKPIKKVITIKDIPFAPIGTMFFIIKGKIVDNKDIYDGVTATEMIDDGWVEVFD